MATKILLLRGVNVGGVKLPMAPFRKMLAGLGLGQVRSYIQSGNAVFDDPGLPDLTGAIAAGLKAEFGLVPALFLYSPQQFDQILAECPYRQEAEAAGAHVHVFFLGEPVAPDRSALQALATTERFEITPRAFYLCAPAGMGRSVLAQKLPRFLTCAMTARNWNTMRALSQMAKT
jgi:uncharacterized protein (DUF1697 family)